MVNHFRRPVTTAAVLAACRCGSALSMGEESDCGPRPTHRTPYSPPPHLYATRREPPPTQVHSVPAPVALPRGGNAGARWERAGGECGSGSPGLWNPAGRETRPDHPRMSRSGARPRGRAPSIRRVISGRCHKSATEQCSATYFRPGEAVALQICDTAVAPGTKGTATAAGARSRRGCKGRRLRGARLAGPGTRRARVVTAVPRHLPRCPSRWGRARAVAAGPVALARTREPVRSDSP